MRLLVVGANGLLGSNVVSVGLRRGWDVYGSYHSTRPSFDIPLVKFDLRNASSFPTLLDRFGPDVVVNCAAMTDVDSCESNPAAARQINGEAPGRLACACADRPVRFVHTSTDYVFDGEHDEPYAEADPTNPLQRYGETKLLGERLVQNELDDFLLTRFSFVYGLHGDTGLLVGFPAWVRDRIESGSETPAFTDQWVSPTRAGQAAKTIHNLIESGSNGSFHVAARSCLTPYRFASLLIDELGYGSDLLQEGLMEDVNRAATRPKNTCLSVEKVAEELGRPQPIVKDELSAISDTL